MIRFAAVAVLMDGTGELRGVDCQPTRQGLHCRDVRPIPRASSRWSTSRIRAGSGIPRP
ncbi:hypothetical protein roselon_01653 [Roseibacterium elongatum DSM 19469]|uniref:Uncharacterized protein n=1 Tax=Roseicyclus elongatus DSM 19469 TaxID=1294273 RepID=W8S1J3_9RHOB|nr:hypothetical protein roselon_01653 [Roseibacterium elongatum DSM 19469]